MSTKFVFLILPHVHILDLAGPDQAIHEAIELNADFSIEYCGIGDDVVTTSGLPFDKLKEFNKVNLMKGDFLMIPGVAFSYLQSKKFYQNKPLFKWINEQYEKGVNICSICLGAFVLAECGLLNNTTCTTHFKKINELKLLYPQINLVENILFTDENNIYTSAGIAAGIDLTLYIIEKLSGSRIAHQVARELVVYHRRKGSAKQNDDYFKYRNHYHNGIHKAQDFIIDHIHIKLSLSELADITNMSVRNFTRVFKSETKVTVTKFINTIRKNKAIELLENPNINRVEIASQIGLKGYRQLNRLLKS